MKAIKEVKREIEKLEATKLDLETKLMQNFKYGFKWYAEGLYKATSMIHEYKQILDSLEKGTELEKIMDYLQGQINRWSVSKSTCLLTVQESIYELESTKEILDTLRWYL